MHKPKYDEAFYRNLIKEAFEASKNAYIPYSHYRVGAALLDENGKVWRGCNIENAGYSPTNCAERTAFFKAVSEGVTKFSAIAVVGQMDGQEYSEDFAAPCGVCRQVMAEFCDDDFEIVMTNRAGDIKVMSLEEILPYRFSKSSLG